MNNHGKKATPNMTCLHLLRLVFILGGTLTMATAADRSLIVFDHGFDVTGIQCTDAKVTLVQLASGYALNIDTGHEKPWSGATLSAPDGHWDLSSNASMLVALRNTGTNPVTIYCRVENPDSDGTNHCLSDSLMLKPGQTNTLKVRLMQEKDCTMDGKLFGMRGYPKASVLDGTNISQLILFVSNPTEVHQFQVTDVRATGEHTRPTAWVTDANPFFPFIDTFGQYKHKEWPGKVHSVAELQERRMAESAELAAHPGPSDWDKYGGLAGGPQLKATGFFRTEKVDGKWWLVDPDGHLFWSHGIDCVRMLADSTPIEERTSWFENFPGDQPEFAEFLGNGLSRRGYYAGRTVKTFSFAGANLKRKYGEHWRQDYPETAQQRLRSWGLNTIANWSETNIFLLRRTAYTDNIDKRDEKVIEGSTGRKRFPDVFDASFAAALRRGMAAKNNASANDPWCLGYFSDNEMDWGVETSLSLGVLRSPADQPAKREFLRDLKAKYGDVEQLNGIWGTRYESWDAFLESRTVPDRDKAREDLVEFDVKLAETYFRTVRDTIKTVAPHQLYLGCRFAGGNDYVAREAGKYCDVVSYNLYGRNISGFKYPGGDKPLLVGEFHFGALDRGLFHPGLGREPLENQAARAEAYRVYVMGALRHPQIVGTHWFQWQDEPTTGRVQDEENYQIGFVDIGDTAYPETIQASRDIGAQFYRIRIGRQ